MPEVPTVPNMVAQSMGRILRDSTHTKYMVTEIPLEPSPHQLRVSRSLARLNLPTWYSDRQSSKQPPDRFRLRDRQKGSSGGWRSKRGTQSAAVTRPTTPESVGVAPSASLRPPGTLSASRSSYTTQRWSYYGGTATGGSKDLCEPSVPPSPAPSVSSIKSTNSFLSYRQPYLGWRAQERLKLSSSYLNPPTQRLASSILNPPNLSCISE